MLTGSLGFVPRTRRPLEALDLGLGLLQAHLGPVLVLWAAQLGILLALLLPFTLGSPLRTLAWIWWLKPWLDRGTLFVLSRGVFHQPHGFFEFLRQWKAVHRRGLVASLLWRRLSPLRAFLLPVFQLEGLGGAAYRARRAVLRRQGAWTAALLTLAGQFFALLTFLGAIGLLQGMLPPGTRMNLWALIDLAPPPWFKWALFGLGLVALTLTEPFYVAAGFALYLNRRTQLEGWDLELAFRRLRARLATGSRTALVLLLLALPLAAQSIPVPPPTEAGESLDPPDSTPLRPSCPARERAQRILREDPAFRHTRTETRPRYRPSERLPRWLRALLDALFGPKGKGTPSRLDPSAFAWVWEIVAILGKALLVGSVVGLVLWLVYRFHHRAAGIRVEGESWQAPEAVAGLDIRPESLPPDVPGSARLLFAKGRAREALALLYRGALAEVVHGRNLDIPPSATEGDCLRITREWLDPPSAEAFRALTLGWQRLAYKAEPPSAEAFEQLCLAWPSAFGGRP